MLDEPTSGLDSHTALNIAKLLKQEAKRGMTILATIHQPSAEIFYTFDRVILLSDGYTIFNGSTKDAKLHLENLGAQFSRYTNPADQMLKLANDPALIIKNTSIEDLARNCKNEYSALSD